MQEGYSPYESVVPSESSHAQQDRAVLESKKYNRDLKDQEMNSKLFDIRKEQEALELEYELLQKKEQSLEDYQKSIEDLKAKVDEVQMKQKALIDEWVANTLEE